MYDRGYRFSEADVVSFAQKGVRLRQTTSSTKTKKVIIVELSANNRSAQLHFERERFNRAHALRVIDYTGLKLGNIPPIKNSAELAVLANQVAELLILQR